MSPFIWISILACSPATDTPNEPNNQHVEHTNEPTLSSIQWVLDWDVDDVLIHENGSWSTETNLDYQVTIDDAWLITSVISLVACDLNQDTGAWSFLGLLLGQRAFAAHAPFSDDSMVELSARESMTPPVQIKLPKVQFEPTQYCSSYWLLARGGPGTDAEQISLMVNGSWSKNGNTGAIRIETNFARAHIETLPPTPANARSVRGTLTRSVATVFDNIDFHHANDYTVAWQAVKNLTERAELNLE